MNEFFPTIYREETDRDISLRVSYTVERYAGAIGCPDEHRGRFSGQFNVTLHSITDESNGKSFEPTEVEHDRLREQALADSGAA